jgi:hypothetical protein
VYPRGIVLIDQVEDGLVVGPDIDKINIVGVDDQNSLAG